ncbi:MAG: hypothetical protein EBR72_07450 [Bacteroidetes bacterium]|nr:hypothetical protein [Bacteroidota bacterium]
MKLKSTIIILIVAGIVACSKQNQSSEAADMYHPSELSQMMRDMVSWSKETKSLLSKGEIIDDVPQSFYDLANQKATRDEHKEAAFQGMVPEYLEALKGIDRKDSQQYYYDASIQACKTCHSVYCGGPLSVIDQL